MTFVADKSGNTPTDKPFSSYNRVTVGSPQTAAVTPQYAGERILDTMNGNMWEALSLNPGSWVPIVKVMCFALLALSFLCLTQTNADAQTLRVKIVASCGAEALSTTNPGVAEVTMDTTGNLCTNAGSNAVIGTTTDAPAPVPTTTLSATEIALLKAIANLLSNGTVALGQTTKSFSVPVTSATDQPYTVPPTQVTGTATGTTAATVATLPAVAAKTNYVCGFTIMADATVLATGTATLAGTISGSMAYLQTIVAVANGTSDLTKAFNPCIAASAVNTAITITSAAAGAGGNTISNIWGYVQ